MKQLLPKLKKINCKKLISKKKSQVDRASRPRQNQVRSLEISNGGS